MRTRIVLSIAALVALQLSEGPAFSHHSNVAFAVETVLTANGTVKQWQWSNPHTWLIMDVDDGKGGKEEWAMEGRAPGVLLRAGWSRSVLKAGDKVTVRSEEHTSELQSRLHLVCRLLLEKKKQGMTS